MADGKDCGRVLGHVGVHISFLALERSRANKAAA
jgi:hypothetical protein